MFRRIFYIAKKEMIQTLRDKRVFGILLVAPMFQLLVFGYVATTDIKLNNAVICDYDQTLYSRDFIRKVSSSGYFIDKYYSKSTSEFNHLLNSGDAVIGITIPPGFQDDLKKGKQVDVSYIVDGTNSNLAVILMGYIQFITADYSSQIRQTLADKNGLKIELPLDIHPRVWFNPELKSVNFMVPGVMAMLSLIILLNLTSLSIVRERELGTAEQLSVTPIKPLELILGKVIPAGFAGYLVTSLVLVVGILWFGINFEGSALLLYFMAGLFMFCAINMGLLISTYSQTGDQAMWANMFVVMPNVLLSGFIFPIDNMPKVIQYVTYLLPMRYYLEVIRGIFLRGAGLADLWVQGTALIGWGIIVITIASQRLRKHLV